MKRILFFTIGLCLFFPCVLNAQAIQLDPGLVVAIETQTMALQDAYKTRNNTQNKLMEAQTAVTGAMFVVHEVEKTILDYMKNASSAMDNLYQLKRAAELIKDIPDNIIKMAKAVPSNYEGTAVSALTTRTATDVTAEITSLYGFMTQLVQSNYTFSGNDNDNSNKKVNLLSASERYYIANTVVSRLEKINNKILNITWQIQNLGWEDGWRNLDPTSWSQMHNGKNIANDIINKWKNTKSF